MKAAQDLGLDVSLLGANDVNELQPGVKMNIEGAYHYRCDAHTTPGVFMNELRDNLISNGVKIYTETEVNAFDLVDKKIKNVNIKLKTNNNTNKLQPEV